MRMRRKRMSRKASRRLFRRTSANTRAINIRPRPRRGGIRM